MLYDPQQRPTVSQSLQYPYFQANNAFPAPLNTAEPIPSTFTRRPVQKSEAEMKMDERAAAKQVILPHFLQQVFTTTYVCVCFACMFEFDPGTVKTNRDSIFCKVESPPNYFV